MRSEGQPALDKIRSVIRMLCGPTAPGGGGFEGLGGVGFAGVLFEVVLFVAVFDVILAVAVAAGALGAGVLLEGALGTGVLFINMMLGYELLKSGERYYKGGG